MLSSCCCCTAKSERVGRPNYSFNNRSVTLHFSLCHTADEYSLYLLRSWYVISSRSCCCMLWAVGGDFVSMLSRHIVHVLTSLALTNTWFDTCLPRRWIHMTGLSGIRKCKHYSGLLPLTLLCTLFLPFPCWQVHFEADPASFSLWQKFVAVDEPSILQSHIIQCWSV